MRNAPPPWLFCLLMLLAGMPARASAQFVPDSATLQDKIDRSHLIDPKLGLTGVDAEQLFKQGLNRIHAREILDNYKNKKGTEAKKFNDLIRENSDFVKKYLKDFQFNDLPPEFRKRFEGQKEEVESFIRSLTLADLQKYAGVGDGLGTSAGPEAPAESPHRIPAPSSEAGASTGTDQKEAPAVAEDPSHATAERDDPRANSVLGRWLLQAADRFKDLEPSLRNSPALSRAIRELSRRVERSDQRWQEFDRGANAIAAKWSHLTETLPFARLWPEKGFSWPRSLTPESWPNWWQLSETGPRPVRQAPLTPPRAGAPPVSQEGGWRSLWMLPVLAAVGLVLWRFVFRSPAAGLRGSAAVWKLGPWPVQPTAVQSREDLVRAFEYLSVLRLGPGARHWHHRAIASGLGRLSDHTGFPGRGVDGVADRRRTAEQLASAYEWARYAPPDEPLPEAALSTARRELCLLAGVPLS